MSRNKVLAPVVAVRTIDALASSAMLPFVVLWARNVAGLAGVAAGVLFIVQALGEFSGGLLGGGLADRLGHRRVLLVSTAGMAAGYGLLAAATTPVLAIALFLVAGVFESAFHPTTSAIVGAAVDDRDLARAFSLVRMGVNTGRIAGPMLGSLAALAALHWVFALSGTLFATALAAEWALLPRDRAAAGAQDDDEPEIPTGTWTALRADPRLRALVIGGGLLAIGLTWWQADGLVVIREQTAVSAPAFAALFTLSAVVVVAGQLPVTRLLASVPASRALLAGALAQAGGLVLLAAGGAGYGLLAAAVVLLALGEMAYAPTVTTAATRLARPGRRASYQAALSITEDIGTAAGPVSGLAMARVATASALWLVAAGVAGAAGFLGRVGAAAPAPQPAEPRTELAAR